MTIRAVVHVIVDVQYDTNDESLTMEAIAKENVPRAINHICSLINEGQKHGIAAGVKFGVANRDTPTVTALIINPAVSQGVPR